MAKIILYFEKYASLPNLEPKTASGTKPSAAADPHFFPRNGKKEKSASPAAIPAAIQAR